MLDFNLDGVDDLCVGEPGWAGWNVSAGAWPLPYGAEPTYRRWGRVTVYLGQKGTGLNAERAATLHTTTDFTALGTVLAAGDVNGDGHDDLLLGAPVANTYDGRVLAFASSATRAAGDSVDVDAAGAALLDIPSPAPFGWFGQSVAVSNRTLLVGAPFARSDPSCTKACQVVGRVFGFALAPTALPVGAAPSFSVSGVEPLGRFGAAIAASGGIVAVSAPDAGAGTGGLVGDAGASSRAGAVTLASAATFASLRGNVLLPSLPSTTTVRGTAHSGRFGEHVSLTPLGNATAPALLSGAPSENGNWATRAGRELGAVYLWRSLPSGNTTTASASWHAKGARAGARFGAAAAVIGGNTRLAVGSPRAQFEAAAEQAGAVDILVPVFD